MPAAPRKPGALGAFCLVLHGHLPWVLHHGRWPHGEDWLYEAAGDSWMPLLEVLDLCAEEGIRPGWTLGITPIVLEQLAHERFRTGFEAYLDHLVERARMDASEFEARGDLDLQALAVRWEATYTAMKARFIAMDRDIAGHAAAHAAAGRIELLSSNATHGYMPLILHDACSRAQLRAGLATSERHFGMRPQGIWLPECAYRPPGPWSPPAVHGDVRWRAGVASILEGEGVRYCVVDTHLVRGSLSEAVIDDGVVHKVTWDQAGWDEARAWGSELEPVRVWEDGRATELTVFGRCPDVAEPVWSGIVGYPGDPRYLEFHKRHGPRGLRYWRVSGKVDLAYKLPYSVSDVDDAVRAHADHFASVVRDLLRAHHLKYGRYGTVCAPFDAELFGHWWAEGPRFLLEVARRLAVDPQIEASTLGDVVRDHPADRASALPEGSWGAGGDHRVWNNDELRLYWEVAYRAEDRFLDLWHTVPWRQDPGLTELLEAAGRELLLLQASDWPFVVSTRGAVDYGLRRIFDHGARFEDLCNGLQDRYRDPDAPTDLTVTDALHAARTREPVFPDLDLEWWGPAP